MRRVFLAAAAAAVLGLMMVAAGPEASAAGSCEGGQPVLDEQEQAFLVRINQYRAQNGLPPLALAPSLNRAAAWLAADMADKGYFAHGDSNGRDPSKRAKDCGFPGDAAENIAAGTFWSGADSAFEAWRNSPGHNANMLNSTYVAIGIGRAYNAGSPYGWYWVTDFGMVQETAPKPAPPPAQLSPTPPRTTEVVVYAGANLVTWIGTTMPAGSGLQGAGGITVIYAFDAASGRWSRFGPGLPSYVNSIHALERGQAYWMIASKDSVIHIQP
ncbi:MAG: CAP domain-containing protein [Dehalococcoidia bacterium]